MDKSGDLSFAKFELNKIVIEDGEKVETVGKSLKDIPEIPEDWLLD